MSSGLTWTAAEVLAKADPYLAWADATQYAGFRLPTEPDEHAWWLVVIELSGPRDGKSPLSQLLEASDPSWLQVPNVYRQLDAQAKNFRYCTARVRRRFFIDVLTVGVLAQVVVRYRLCSPVEYPVQPLQPPSAEPPSEPTLAGHNGGPVIALIDGGMAMAHSAFLNAAGQPRTAHFWRQDDFLGSRYPSDRVRTSTPWPNAGGHWRVATDMGYGAEIDRANIQAVMAAHTLWNAVDEDAVYRALGLWDLDRMAHHGTHVLSLATGPYRYPAQMGSEDAPPVWDAANNNDLGSPEGCDLLGVQLAWANVLDTSGRSGEAHILDALMYVWSRCADAALLVVNLSWGNNAGPHDGSSILERAMLDWCGLRTGESFIVVPAGNSYQARGHANSRLSTGQSLALKWKVPPQGHTPSFLELWFDREIKPDDLEVQVTPPEQPPFSLQAPGVQIWRGAATAPVKATLVLLNRPNLGTRGSMALIALEPTAGDDAARLAPSGEWTIKVTNHELPNLTVSAYIERNDVALGMFTGAKQSYFEDELYNGGDGIDDPAVQRATLAPTKTNASPVRRTGSFNSLSTGSDNKKVLSVGGTVHFPTQIAGRLIASPYSPRWADDNDTRVPGKKKAPDKMMLSDDSLVLWGLRAAGSRSGAVVRLVGTSSAVPLAVRLVASGTPPPSRPLPPPPPPVNGNGAVM